jgi:hypothetical protein
VIVLTKLRPIPEPAALLSLFHSMSCTIDHLCVDHHVRIIRDFTDARGQRHRANETGIIRRMALEWPEQIIAIEWERDGSRETMRFSSLAREGPRNGAMREYFELGDRVFIPRPSPAEVRRIRQRDARPQGLPALDETLVTDPARWAEAVNRIEALALRQRYDDAEKQIQAVTKDVGPTGWRLKQLADDVGELADAHAGGDDRTLYLWLRDRAINLLHAWGSCATSGGEGEVCRVAIDAWKRRFAELDRF